MLHTDDECPICYQEFTGVGGKRTARRLPCGCRKSMCQSCIDHILSTSDTCPFCRGILICQSGRELPICDSPRTLRAPASIYIGSPYAMTTGRLQDMQHRLKEVRRYMGSRRHRSASDLVQEALKQTTVQLEELEFARTHTPYGRTEEDVELSRPGTPQQRPGSGSGSRRPGSAAGSHTARDPAKVAMMFDRPLTARAVNGQSSRAGTPRTLGVCRTPVRAVHGGDGDREISLSSLYQTVNARPRPQSAIPSYRQAMNQWNVNNGSMTIRSLSRPTSAARQ